MGQKKQEDYIGLCANCMHFTVVGNSDGSIDYTCPFFNLVAGETIYCGHYEEFCFVI